MAHRQYDAIVIGGGLLGSATAYALARSKNSVLLLDSRAKGHAEGSSHGHSRIVRTVASESQQFGAMAEESFRRMQEMNSPRRFVARPVEALFMSFGETDAFKELARQNHQRPLNSQEIFETWGIQLPEAGVGTVDRLSGIVDPAALLDIFYDEIGAENIRWQTPVTSWSANGTEVTVTTTTGEGYSGGKLVLAAGAWLPALLRCGTMDREVSDRLARMTVQRIPLYYFDYPAVMPPVIPITLFDNGYPDMYAMPEFDGPIATPAAAKPRYLKVGFHKGIEAKSPEDMERSVHPHEERHAAEYMRERLGLRLTLRHTGICLYAMLPDLREPGEEAAYNELPLIGALPRTPSVFLAAYGAGICAKHALVIGEQVSLLVAGRRPSYDLSEFEPAKRLRLD
jgi:sarcosine oxidase